MKVLHVIPSLSPTQGGPSVALPAMARALGERGVEVDVATTDDDGAGRRLESVALGEAIQADGFTVFYFRKQTEFYKCSLPLALWLRRNVWRYDLVHVHAVFSFSSIVTCWTCIAASVPFVVRPLGVLNSWGMENRRASLKALSFRLLEKPALDRAARMHYTSNGEAADASRLGIKAPPSVIPLGIETAAFRSHQGADKFLQQWPQVGSAWRILFMSRLDPKKGIKLLLEAFAKVLLKEPASNLVIAGKGAPEYEAQLRAQSDALRISQNVLWVGHLAGSEKFSALAAATLFVLPSHSENFGIALLEAMAAGVACIATDGVALAAECAEEGAVYRVPSDPSALAEAIISLLRDAAARSRLASRGEQVAQDHYSASVMGERLVQLYRSCLSERATRKEVE